MFLDQSLCFIFPLTWSVRVTNGSVCYFHLDLFSDRNFFIKAHKVGGIS